MFDFVEVRTVGREIFKGVTRLCDSGLCVGATVESRAVHHQYDPGWQLREEITDQPRIEYVGIDIGLGQTDARQDPGKQRPDDIDPPPGLPVMAAMATLPPPGAYPWVRGMSWAKPLSSM